MVSLLELADSISLVGFGVGLIIASYLQGHEHEPMRHWAPFVALSVVFALFVGESFFVPFGATARTAALLLLLAIEIYLAWLVSSSVARATV